MIAVNIGRTFLNAWNQKNRKDYTGKDFFEKEFFPLFFDHPKYMQWVTNSPFVQMKKGQKPHLLTSTERKEKLEDLLNKIEKGSRDASIAIGFPASEEKEFATTSGLVTDIELDLEEEDVYLSWIGGGLGIGVAGGYSVIFDQPEILLTLYEGWGIYRKFLDDETLVRLRGNQINTWNGQWLNFAYNRRYIENPDFGYLQSMGIFKQDEKMIEVDTVFWTKLFFNLSRNFEEETLMAYVYSLGQTNKTVGFVPFQFKHGRYVMDIYKALFGEHEALSQASDYEALYGIHIKRACELGAVGLQALEPKGLRNYFSGDKKINFYVAPVKEKTGEPIEAFAERRQKATYKEYENTILFRTYKTWLLAMITKNKQEDLKYSEEVAIALVTYRADAKKRDRANLIEKELLVAKSKKQFLDGLAIVIKSIEQQELELFKTLRDKVHLMTSEDFGYFIVLLKFDYAYQEKLSETK